MDPKDGSLVGTVQSADEADVAAAVQAAVSAAEGWAATAPAERGALLQGDGRRGSLPGPTRSRP